jgi:hypothetical protein
MENLKVDAKTWKQRFGESKCNEQQRVPTDTKFEKFRIEKAFKPKHSGFHNILIAGWVLQFCLHEKSFCL